MPFDRIVCATFIIYHKNYSHNTVPAATVAMATNALSQTEVCANSVNSSTT